MASLEVDSTPRKVDPLPGGISHKCINLNGKRYHILHGEPATAERVGHACLVHGFHDLSFGWRYMIPSLQQLGFEVFAIDCMGYGGTDAPRVPPESIKYYTFKRCADDVNELARAVGASKFVLGGHDWGGLIVARIAQWYPELVAGVFSAGTPYLPPEPRWLDFDEYTTKYPTFKYQRLFGSQMMEERLSTEAAIRLFFVAGYYGKGPNGELPFSTDGPLFENWPKLIKSDVLSDEELDYYAQEYSRHGIHGPLNWYRNREQTFEEEKALDPEGQITCPYLFIQSLQDPFLPPSMAEGMEKYIPNLRRREAECGHFSLVLKPDVINKHVSDWLIEVVIPQLKKDSS